MASGRPCLLYPQIGGQDSKMYKELLKKLKDRPLVNWIYSYYLASDADKKMAAAGYTPNNQGEFKASDLLKFLDYYKTMGSEINNLADEAFKWDATDRAGNPIDYTNAKDALEKANDFNDNHTGLVATVFQRGDVYNLYVSEKNIGTHLRPTEVKEKLAIWDVYKQAFNSIGIDIENLPSDLNYIFNANQTDIARYLKGLQSSPFKYLQKAEALLLFNMDPNSALVQRVLTEFGTLEDAAQMVSNINNGVGGYTVGQKNLLERAIQWCQKIQNLDLTDLQNQVDSMKLNVQAANPEADIQQTFHQLKKKYSIDINELHMIGNKIHTLSEAVGEAVLQLERKIRELERTSVNDAEGKRLEGVLNQLMKELEYKKYYNGVLGFLNEATTAQQAVEDMIDQAKNPTAATEIEKLYEQAKLLMDIKQVKDQYYSIIDALANESLKIDESISKTDIDNMRNTAKDLKDFFDKNEMVIEETAQKVMEGLLIEIVGNEAPDGQSIVNLVKMAQKDTSIMDYLYSVGRSSSPVIAAMGEIIRSAQGARDVLMNDISLRIARATDKLSKSGSNTEFMYEDDEHIISDIDWNFYNAALEQEKKSLRAQGLKGFDFKMALNQWEEDNTEDRIVDVKSGRTERVPNAQYRKLFPNLTQAQLEYYNEMMQIKGEIGTLLPAYAQNHYLAPQVRRSMLDAIGHAKSAQDVIKAIGNKFKNFWTVREDDTNYAKNGIVEGEEYTFANGNFENKRLRDIPIFFVNKVEKGELLKEFSTGLQHLAGTAINYDAMNRVKDVVEFIGDFAKKMPSRDEKNEADIVENQAMRVIKGLYSWAQNTNTSALIDGYISQHIYGEKRDPNENSKWQKFIDNIIGYTSFKGLATNIKGAFSNYLVGEFQMLIEAGCGEFYGFKNYFNAHTKLFGGAGVPGEIMDLFTNNRNSRACLFREMFDPLNENFQDKKGQRYYHNWFRQLISHDCSFIGYASGEYLIHYVNMYAILDNEKVLHNGKLISLYDAFEVGNKKDGNSELLLKAGVTKRDGTAIDAEYLTKIRDRIRYCNQTTHGSMNEEDKGLIHKKWWGRSVMNFRQWMVEHYSRRFRKTHFDDALKENREGYWYSYFKYLFNENTKEDWNSGVAGKAKVIGQTLGESVAIALPWFMRDYMTFMLRAESQWNNLSDMQKNNIKRVNTEMMMYIMLMGLSFALGEPDEHKKQWWRRWWIYQVKRLMLDMEASMPHPKAVQSGLTILQSPMAGINTLNGFLYTFTGVGDIGTPLKSGPHKGEDKYWRNFKKYNLPFFKDWEQMQRLGEDEAIFQPFKSTPSNR